MEQHDRLWLRNKELLKEGAIDINTFDSLPRKRIERLLRLQEEGLEEQQKYFEEQQKEQERKAARKMK